MQRGIGSIVVACLVVCGCGDDDDRDPANVCGDGVLDDGEACDPGASPATCNLDCTASSCGDGKVNQSADPAEQCDDANDDATDGCLACRLTSCGNGVLDEGEECDRAASSDACNLDCTASSCGDGKVNPSADPAEQCDDSNDDPADGCHACRLTSCGNGVLDEGEECDRAASPDACNLDCTASSCGDGKVNPNADPAEQCDDSNDDPTDGCDACRLTSCGNGVLDEGEQCDGAGGQFGCSPDCFLIECGNGILDQGEECDDGNAIDSDHCISSNPDPETCRAAFCGDGLVDTLSAGAEECDDGADNAYSGDCLPSCQLNVCGDGFPNVDGDTPEACDDGAANGTTSCPYGTATCAICNASCTAAVASSGNVCGDGDQDASNEQCDDGNSSTETSCPYGEPSCVVCSATCTEIDETGSVCGDGVTDEPDEICDDGNTLSCGSCSATCRGIQLAAATGIIAAIPGSQIIDGETFVIDDGLSPAVVFEFNPSGGSSNVPVPILSSDSASAVAQEIRLAINQSGIGVDAVANGPLVSLTNQVETSLGNLAIGESVADPDFYVAGMSGGEGADCPAGVECASGQDCASGSCGFSTSGICD